MEVPLKDIALAVTGGATGIASVLLVFVAFIVSRRDSLPSETSDAVTRKYTTIAQVGFAPFLIQLLTAFAAYWWLFHMASSSLLVCWKYGFLVALGSLLLYAAWIFWMIGTWD